MTKTVNFDLTGDYTEIADSTNDTTVTIYNRSSYTLGVVVDERDEATRITDGDENGIVYLAPGESHFESGFTGAIKVKHMTSLVVDDCHIAVIKS